MKRNAKVNLLLCLHALLTERSVTRAAQRMEMSQPGMSNALARLRELTGDPLLVRTAHGLVPTERAQALEDKVRAAIELMDGIFSNEGPLDLAGSTGTVTIAAPDALGITLLPEVARALAEAAPGVTLNVRAPHPEHLREWLVEGECDLALGHFPQVHEGLRTTLLFTQDLSCLSARAPGEEDGPISLDEYLQRTHVVFGSPFGSRSTLETTLGEALAALGLPRPGSVEVSSLQLIPYLVAGSPHVATLPTWIAQHYAGILPLRVSPLPFATPPIECRMVWHERTHRQALHVWLRDLVRRIAPGPIARGPHVQLAAASARKAQEEAEAAREVRAPRPASPPPGH